jgi:hypothetical protein
MIGAWAFRKEPRKRAQKKIKKSPGAVQGAQLLPTRGVNFKSVYFLSDYPLCWLSENICSES